MKDTNAIEDSLSEAVGRLEQRQSTLRNSGIAIAVVAALGLGGQHYTNSVNGRLKVLEAKLVNDRQLEEIKSQLAQSQVRLEALNREIDAQTKDWTAVYSNVPSTSYTPTASYMPPPSSIDSYRDDHFVENLLERLAERNVDVPARLLKYLGNTQLLPFEYAPLQEFLNSLNIDSRVTFKTSKPGAVVRYRLFASNETERLGKKTDTTQDIPIGIYWVWAERDGHETSRKEAWRIVEEVKTIEIDEVLLRHERNPS